MFNAYRDSFNKNSTTSQSLDNQAALHESPKSYRRPSLLTNKVNAVEVRMCFFYIRRDSLDKHGESRTSSQQFTKTIHIDTNYCGTKLQKLRKV